MAKILLNITDELKAKLQEKAKQSNRTMTSHLISLIERDLNMVEIPVRGVVKDGKVYWDSPEGIEQLR